MTPAPLISLAALMLAGCTALASDRLPGCEGPRRPANPHGSILSPGAAAPPPVAAPPAAGCARRAR